MKRARLIKRDEQIEREITKVEKVKKPVLTSLNRDVVRQWVDERQTRSVTDPRSAFSALFAQLAQS